MKKYIYSTMVAMALMALTACSSSDGDIIAESTTAEDEAVAEAAATGTITFSIGNSTTRSATTRAEIQTDEEKEVTSLIAVIFRDLKKSLEESGVTDEELGTETFYEYQEIDGIDEDNPLDSTVTYSMKIETDGHFQIIFIANPSDNLISELDGYYKGSNLITEFKEFEETQDPSTKPMTMESDHTYGVISAEDTKLGTIHLSRIMSRIDILNLADGITIDSVKFVNRTVKSVLVNDNSSTLNTEYVEEEEKMYTMSLVGNHYHTEGVDEDELSTATTDTVNAYKWKIYSYEQYGTDDDAPYLVLYYHIGSNTSQKYSHTVEFKTTTDGTSTQVNLERNYYYLVSVSTSDTGYINFALAVADWVDGAELYVSAETIDENAAYETEEDTTSDDEEEEE